MNKTSVYLSDDEKERLAHLARIEGKSQADIIRAAIRQYRVERTPVLESALEGCFAGDGTSIAEVPEDELMRGFGE
jgi:predicted transcriptional regulator